MLLPGAQHEDRFAKMEKDINTRHPEMFFFIDRTEKTDTELVSALETLSSQMKVVGPFGPHFLKEKRTQYKTHLYGIPLQRLYIDREEENYEAVAFISTNPYSSIMLKSVMEYIRYPDNARALKGAKLSLLCIQTADTPNGQTVVISAEYVTDLKPLAVYEHPPNGRLIMASMGEELPDHSSIVMYGSRAQPIDGLFKTLATASSYYNDFVIGNLDRPHLSINLLSLFKEPT